MAKINLDPIQREVESFMIDSCEIYEETKGEPDPDSGLITTVTRIVYTGKCLLGQPTVTTDGNDQYQLMVPLSVTDIKDNYWVTMIRTRDPMLQQQTFEIIDPTYGTYAVYRAATVSKRQQPGT